MFRFGSYLVRDDAPQRDPSRSRLLFNVPSIASIDSQLIVM
jgi:hypothetical protein